MGSSAFGSKPPAPAFGQSSGIGLGHKASPWAAGSTSGAAPAFGQTGFPSAAASPGKVFGSSGAAASPGKVFGSSGAAPASGGFANFASKPGGFADLGGVSGGQSIFGSKPGGPLTSSAPEVSMDSDTAFPPPAAKSDKPVLGSAPFVLGTTFKADRSADDDIPTPKGPASKSLFGSGFGLSLDNASKQRAPESKDQDMESTTPPPVQEQPKSVFSPESTTPTSTPAPQKFDFKNTAGGSDLFGSKPSAPRGMSNIFGAPQSTTSSLFGTPKVKQEAEDKADLSKIPEAPLPPYDTIKALYFLIYSSSVW
jgi:nucleoporin NUP159